MAAIQDTIIHCSASPYLFIAKYLSIWIGIFCHFLLETNKKETFFQTKQKKSKQNKLKKDMGKTSCMISRKQKLIASPPIHIKMDLIPLIKMINGIIPADYL